MGWEVGISGVMRGQLEIGFQEERYFSFVLRIHVNQVCCLHLNADSS